MASGSIAGRLLTLLDRYLELTPSELKAYGSHSMRRGGATYYFARGLTKHQLKSLGRWKSHAFELYTETLLDRTTALITGVLRRELV